MKVSHPIPVTLPAYGVLFAESVHATDFQMTERADPFHKVFYVLAGAVACRCGDQAPEAMSAGSMFVVPRDVPHHLEDREAPTLLLLCLSDGFLAKDPDLPTLWRGLQGAAPRRIALSRPARERVERLWRRAMLEKSHAQIGGEVTVRALAAQLLVLLARQQRSESSDTAAVRVAAVARELRESLYDEWNVDRAAARAGLSRRRFTELFRVGMGRSFAEELTNLRLEHAARLLRGGEHTILGVMFSCGYSDVSHFYRAFRQKYGAPPKRWLEEQRPKRRKPTRET